MEVNGGEQSEGNKRGGRQSRGRGRKSFNKKNVQCYTCNEFRHYSTKCWHNEAAKNIKNDEATNLAQDTYDSESNHVLLMRITERVSPSSAVDEDTERSSNAMDGEETRQLMMKRCCL